jgi:hypothetical protein
LGRSRFAGRFESDERRPGGASICRWEGESWGGCGSRNFFGRWRMDEEASDWMGWTVR